MATTGTIGTPSSSASLTNPVRPAKSISADSHDGRNVSWSPPGYTSSAASRSSARRMFVGLAGTVP